MRTLPYLLLLLALPAAAEDVAETPPEAPPPTVQDGLARLQAADYDGAIRVLEPITVREAGNAEAWLLLGLAYQAKGDLRRALPAHLKATAFEATAPQAMLNTASVYALIDQKDDAFKWLERLGATGRFDMTRLLADPDLQVLREDARFAKLLPQAKDYARPFVDPAPRIVHQWDGEAAGDQFGWIARNIGDVDGDAIADVATSAPSKDIDGPAAGRVYVYSGKSGKLRWTRSGKPGDQLGLGLSAAGDTDHDGVGDVIAGAPGLDTAYVFSGRDGQTLRTLEGPQKGEMFGSRVAGIGDIDGDGHDEVLVGAPLNDAAGEDAGRAYVFSGKDGAALRTWSGERAHDRFGAAAAGFRDAKHALIVVGAPGAGPARHGRAYVYVGGQAEPRFAIESDATGASLGGMFVSVVGDVDGDGVPDVYAADAGNDALGPSTGRAYVHSGKDGSRLMTLTGEAAGDGFGVGVANAGDADGDGHADLIIGAWNHGGAAFGGGKSYLYSGKTGEPIRTYTCRVVGDTFGFDTTGMGDVDRDGTLDFLITSASSAVAGYRSGRMLLISSGVVRP